MILAFFCELWDMTVTKVDHRVEIPSRRANLRANRIENQVLRLTRFENVNETARNQLELVHQQNRRSSELNIMIPGNAISDLPPTYEDCMRSS